MLLKFIKNEGLENFIKGKIQYSQIRIDEKTDVDEMQRGLAKASKRNILKRPKKR